MATILVDTRGSRGSTDQRTRRDAAAAAAAAEQPPAAASTSEQLQEKDGKKDQKRSKKEKEQQKKQQQKEREQTEAALPALAGSSLQGVVGARQPSPLDQGFSRVEPPWAGRDLGDLSLAPLQLREGELTLPHVQTELPAKAVDPKALDALQRDDLSVPGLRQRSHIAMRAAAAAMEASQRAVAYSAAASSAAARATEAAESAAAAAADVQVRLELMCCCVPGVVPVVCYVVLCVGWVWGGN